MSATRMPRLKLDRFTKYLMATLLLWVGASCQSVQVEPVQVKPLTHDQSVQVEPVQAMPLTHELLFCAQQAVYTSSVEASGQVQTRKILDLPEDATCPIWSPDGKLALLYRIKQSGFTLEDSLSLVERQSGTILQVYRFGPRDNDWAIRWLPDGISLLLTSARDDNGTSQRSKSFTERSINGTGYWGRRADVYSTTIHVQGMSAPLERLTFSPSPRCALAWSPDGKKFVYARAVACFEGGPISDVYDGGIDVFDMQTRAVVTLSDPEADGLHQSNAFVQWSPDGSKVLFDALLMPDKGSYKHRMLVADVKSSRTYTLTPEGARIGYWSSDGQKIMWENNDGALGMTDTKSTRSLEVQSPEGYFYVINQHGWSPDSQHFVWFEQAADNKQKALRAIDIASGKTITLTTLPVYSWSWSPDSQWLAFSAHTIVNPNQCQDYTDVYIMKPDGTSLHHVTEGQQLSALQCIRMGWGSDWYRDRVSEVQWVPR